LAIWLASVPRPLDIVVGSASDTIFVYLFGGAGVIMLLMLFWNGETEKGRFRFPGTETDEETESRRTLTKEERKNAYASRVNRAYNGRR
jgi:hypothetical protein